MLSLQDLAQLIHEHINKSSIQFQSFLAQPEIHMHPELVKVVSDLLSSTIHTRNNKILAAGALNFIFVKRINQDDYQGKLWTCWNEYFDLIVNKKHEAIEWGYLQLTKRALKTLLEELNVHVVQRSLQKYTNSCFYGKLLLLQAFKQHYDISEANQLIFFRQTIEDFVIESSNFLNDFHNHRDFDVKTFNVEEYIMMVIYEWLLAFRQSQDKCHQSALYKLSTKEELSNLIKQELKIVVQVSDNKLRFKCRDEIFFIQDSSTENSNSQQLQKVLYHQVNIKSYAIGILNILALTFSFNCGLNDFDNFPILGLFESIIPVLIGELDKNQSLKRYYDQQQKQPLHTSYKSLLTFMFSLLKSGTNFIFLMQLYSQLKDIVMYSIFLTYLRTSQDQIQTYHKDGDLFLEISENFIQKQFIDITFDTPKQACGTFLKGFFCLITQTRVEFLKFLAAAFKHALKNQESQILTIIQQKGFMIPSVELIYVCLTRIFFFSDSSNKEIFDFIYQNFVEPEEVFQLQNLDKTRFLILMSYCYGIYFKENFNLGSKYILFSSQTKNNSPVEFSTFILLLESSFKYQLPEQIWQYLMSVIEQTREIKEIKLLKHLLQRKDHAISLDKIIEATQRVCKKASKQFLDNKEDLVETKGDPDILYCCFHILQIIIQDKNLTQNYPELTKQFVQIVDFFADFAIENLSFNEEIVKILNTLIKIQEQVPIEFRRYLPMLNRIVCKDSCFGPLLFQIYYLILLKGKQTFEAHSDFLQQIQESIEEKILNPSKRNSKLMIEAFFLLQNIYLVYPLLIRQNRHVYETSLQIFQEQKLNSSSADAKLIASILLFWMSGEYAFGKYNVGAVSECKIEIFTEQFGLMFALNLRKLVQKHFDSDSLQYLLKLFLKLLDYEHYYKKLPQYIGPKFYLQIFESYLILDSCEQMNSAIQFLKENLSREKFNQCAQMIKRQVGQKVATELLTKRIINSRKERQILTVKRI